MAVEIDEAQLDQYQRMHRLLNDLQGSPKTRSMFSKAVKQLHPDIQTPEDVAEEIGGAMLAPVNEQLKTVSEQLAAMKKAQDDRDARAAEASQIADMTSAFARLRKEGLQDEGEQAIKQLMVDRKIADPEAAYALFMRQNPPAAEVHAASWEPQHWDIRNNTVDVDVDGLWKNPDAWADKAVGRILMEERGRAA
jgi:hypothetical protein